MGKIKIEKSNISKVNMKGSKYDFLVFIEE